MNHEKFRRMLLIVAGGIIALVIAVKIFSSKSSASSTPAGTDASGNQLGQAAQGITVLEFQQAQQSPAPGGNNGITGPPPPTSTPSPAPVTPAPTIWGGSPPLKPGQNPGGPGTVPVWTGQPIVKAPATTPIATPLAPRITSAGSDLRKAAAMPRPAPRPGTIGGVAAGAHRVAGARTSPVVAGLSTGKQRSLNRLTAA